eukprot:403352447
MKKLCILSLLTLSGLIYQTFGRSQQTDLLEIYDWMEIYDSHNNVKVGQIDLQPFPFLEQFTQNITVRGSLCFAKDFNEFKLNCVELDEDMTTYWVILTPFDYDATNDLLNLVADYNVGGVVIGTDTQIDSAGYYSRPEIISLIPTSKLDFLQQFAFPVSKNHNVKMIHEYLTNCQVLNTVSNYFLGICTSYGLVILIWIMSILFIYNDQVNTLQKALLVVPIFKLLRISIYTFYISECPWTDQLTSRYLMMALVTVSTIYQTVFIAVLLLISKGWMITRTNLTRSQATMTTMLMGAVYLVYSAYYVSANMESVKNLIGMFINILYLGLYAFMMRNSMAVLTTLKYHQSLVRTNDVTSIYYSLSLKRNMMTKFIYIITAYFLFEIVVHGILPMMSDDKSFDSFTTILYQFYDFTLNLAFLWVFRPRQWPTYFNLNILEQPFLGVFGAVGQSYNDDQEQRQLAPLKQALLKCYSNLSNDKLCEGDSLSNQSFTSDCQVLIYNPLFGDSSLSSDNMQIRNRQDDASEALQSNCQYRPLNEKEILQKKQNTQLKAQQSLTNKILRSLQIGTKDKNQISNNQKNN